MFTAEPKGRRCNSVSSLCRVPEISSIGMRILSLQNPGDLWLENLVKTEINISPEDLRLYTFFSTMLVYQFV